MLLKGMKALVTGGSLGIGSAIVTTLAKEGSDVSTIYRKHDREVKEILRKVEMFGREGIALKADVSDFKKAQEVVNEVLKTFGKLDILVLNAGINWDSVIWKMTEEQWDRVIEVNLKGYFNYARAVVPIFKEQKFGKIVNITSINGLRGKFGQTNYSASKAGIIGLTKALAKELGRYNVNVNAVAPGMIETEMFENIPEKFKEIARSESVLSRLGKPEDVANLAAFLCSEKARHITGEVIKVDGGQYI